MKRFLAFSAYIIVLILVASGCALNEDELYKKWESENRVKWEQEATREGYENGYDDGFKDGETDAIRKSEEETEQKEKDLDAIMEQYREIAIESIRKYADEFECFVWDDLEKFDFTIDLQRTAIGKQYAVMAYPTDLTLSSDSIVMRAKGSELPDLFYLEIPGALENTARAASYEDCALIITVESVAPLDVIQNCVEYGNVLDGDFVSVGDATISYDLSTDYRLVTGTCEAIIPIEYEE